MESAATPPSTSSATPNAAPNAPREEQPQPVTAEPTETATDTVTSSVPIVPAPQNVALGGITSETWRAGLDASSSTVPTAPADVSGAAPHAASQNIPADHDAAHNLTGESAPYMTPDTRSSTGAKSANAALPSVTFQPIRIAPPSASANTTPLSTSLPGGPLPDVPSLAPPLAAPFASATSPAATTPGANTRAVTLSPVLAMLVGGVLACVLVALGMTLGARGRPGGAGGFAGAGVSAQSGDAIVEAVRQVAPAVVNVNTTFGARLDANTLPTPGMGSQPQKGAGTGVIFDSKRGLMLTNAHVVTDSKTIEITTRDGKKYSGRVWGSERKSDIAVVELSNKTLPQARLADLDKRKLNVGEWAIAIGNPFGRENTTTVGVVSAVGREISGPGRDGKTMTLKDMIQTDAAINPGNSGGALCNTRGEVIGINTAIFGIGTGLGFAIPIDKAKRIADRLIAQGRVLRPFIGIEMEDVDAELQQSYGLPDRNGGLITVVTPKSPAARAGLEQGDVVRSVDGQPVKAADDVPRLVGKKKIGSTVKIGILRNSSIKRTLTLRVENKPNEY